MVFIRSPVNRLPIRNRKQWATNLLLAALATEFLGTSITVPIMAQYAASFHVDPGLIGLVFSIGSFATLLSDLWLPRVSDTYGRKRAIVLSVIGSTTAYTMEAAAPTFHFLLFAAFCGGLFGGTPPVAVAYISDIYTPAERPQYIGYVPAIVSACFVMGPTIGGFIANATNSFRVPIIVSAVVCGGLALPLVVFFVPDPKILVCAEEKKEIMELNKREVEKGVVELSVRGSSVLGSLKTSSMELKQDEVDDESSGLLQSTADYRKSDYPGPWRDFRCWVCLFISLFNNTVFSCFVTTIPLVLEKPTFGLTSKQDAVYYTGLVMGCAACVQAAGLAILFRTIQNTIGLIHTIYLGTFVSLLGYIYISFQTTIFGMAIGFSIFSLGNCLTRPGYTSHITNIVPTEFTARAIAMPTIAASVAGLVSPIVSSELLSETSYHLLYRCASGVLLLQLILILVFLRGEKEEDKKKIVKEEEEEEMAVGQTMGEEEFIQELVAVLKHRNYDLNCSKAQKVILEIAHRSFPYLNYENCNKDCDQIAEEMNIPDCKEKLSKMRRRTIANRASMKPAAAQLTQLG